MQVVAILVNGDFLCRYIRQSANISPTSPAQFMWPAEEGQGTAENRNYLSAAANQESEMIEMQEVGSEDDDGYLKSLKSPAPDVVQLAVNQQGYLILEMPS